MKNFFWAWLETLRVLAVFAGISGVVAGLSVLTVWHPLVGGVLDFFALTLALAWLKTVSDDYE